MRKKVSEMTPFERVDRVMNGFTREEAETVAVKILGQLVARAIHVDEDEEYFRRVMHKVIDETMNYRKEHSFELAASKVVLKEIKENKDESGRVQQITPEK